MKREKDTTLWILIKKKLCVIQDIEDIQPIILDNSDQNLEHIVSFADDVKTQIQINVDDAHARASGEQLTPIKTHSYTPSRTAAQTPTSLSQ